MTDSFEAVLNDPEVTCIVEALPGRDPALSYIRAALAAGKHVVTSNKAAVAADLKGYAEADPTADITGADVRNKAIISASLAYRTPVVSDIPTAGIVGVTSGIIAAARERGRSLRLMMLSERRGDRYAVGIVPVLLSQDEIAAHVHDNLNYGRITGDVVGALSIVGRRHDSGPDFPRTRRDRQAGSRPPPDVRPRPALRNRPLPGRSPSGTPPRRAHRDRASKAVLPCL